MVPVDRDKLRSHLDSLRGTMRRLEELKGRGRRHFLDDDVSQAAAARWLQTAVEAIIDIGNHIVAREGLGVPRAYADTVRILLDEGVIPGERSESFLAMVRFRNRLVHLYDHVLPEELWTIMDEDLGDFEAFIAAIVSGYLMPGD